ncbi:hypothetical protein WMY93_023133 [Mugilogobius chulae]|uniref:Protection of telomeres protein 1 n=1 Tax=Mugilogobius chulae TaxID=88201 RepID=A0AAW0N7U8_9GOBI
MHRVKVKTYKDSLSLISTHGFSAVTFDGTEGQPVEPWSSSQTYHFDADDQRVVEELRAWAAGQDLLPMPSSMTLAMVQTNTYFDLTCQLLAKAPIDASCMLLRVWDGTKCPHTLLKVLVEPGLKPGDFLKIFNLRALSGSSKVPGLTASQPVELPHLAFHLHGGTAFGRGIRVLPANSPTVTELRRVIEAFIQDEDDCAMLDIWGTPPESVDTEAVTDSITETTCRHTNDKVSLAEVKRSNPGQVHHVKVQLKSYQPHKLHQSLKLFCDKCSTMQDVPDEDHVSHVFSAALLDRQPCSAPVWALSGQVQLPFDPAGPSSLSLYFSHQLMSDGKNKQLMFLKGASLEQVKKLCASYLNIVPVRSHGGQLALMDLSVPVLFRGRRRFYGCKKCSNPTVREPAVEGVEVVSEKLVAEALGVELLRYVLLLRLELHDSSGSLDVHVVERRAVQPGPYHTHQEDISILQTWSHQCTAGELFFNVSAADVASNQEAQDHISQTMDSLCPPEGSTAGRPWLDMCLVSYRAKDDDGTDQTVYQVCHTSLSKTEPDPA